MTHRLITRDRLGCFAGQSSMCWIPVPSTQVFDSENAVKQLDELWNKLPTIDIEAIREVCEVALYNEWVTPLDVVTKAKAILEILEGVKCSSL